MNSYGELFGGIEVYFSARVHIRNVIIDARAVNASSRIYFYSSPFGRIENVTTGSTGMIHTHDSPSIHISESDTGAIICNDNCASFNVTHNIINDGGISRGGISINAGESSLITDNTIRVTDSGITILYSSSSTIARNHVYAGENYSWFDGVRVYDSRDVVIAGNEVSGCKIDGSHCHGYGFYRTTGTTIKNNESNGAVVGIELYRNQEVILFQNNFVNNQQDILLVEQDESAVQAFQTLPYGGNYWDRYDTPTDGCSDGNADGFCDTAYTVLGTNLIDQYPRVMKVGATTSPQTVTEKAVEKAKAVIGGPYTFGAKGWDFALKKYLESLQIKAGDHYTYQNPNTNAFDATGKGLDCSGLSLWSYNSSHESRDKFANTIIKFPSADGQYWSNATLTVPVESVQPGDLMFFDWGTYYDEVLNKWVGPKNGKMDHVAMYVGDQGDYDVVHAASESLGIISTTKERLMALSLNPEVGAGFVGFRRLTDPNVHMSMTTDSPIDLIVTDPEGFTITPETVVKTDVEINHEIPGELYYSVYDVEDDGTPKTEVYSPHLKQGNYLIKPIKRADAAPGSVYGLTVTTDFGTTVLAEGVPVEDIPEAGYGVRVTESGVETFVPDNTPPEAVISVDPITKDLKVVGVDETSSTTVAKIASGAYVITDAASNTTKLLFQKNYSGKLLSYAKLIGVQYNNAPITPVATSSMLYIWNPTTNPPTLLSQTLVVNNTFGIEAVFDRKKNQTTVLIKKKGIPMQSQKFTGLTIIKLTTDNGVVGYAL